MISDNYVKIKLLLTDTWHVLFWSFVFDFDFPLQCCIFVRFFMLFTSNVLNTLRQHIWCSPFFSNNFTKKSQRQHKGLCVFFESCAYFATNGKTFCQSKPNLSDRLTITAPCHYSQSVVGLFHFSLSPQTIHIHFKNMAIIACLLQYSAFGYSA